MTKDDEREVQRKLRVLQHAERTGQIAKTNCEKPIDLIDHSPPVLV